MTVLDDIVAGVRADLEARRSEVSLDALQRLAADRAPALDPMPAFRAPGLSVIAEVKRRSPSKGHLAEIPEPAALAAEYEAGGAAAISVLTEPRRFSGSLADLDAVRERVTIPVLRKDFMVDEYQVWEARAHGADLILLIVAALTDDELASFGRLAASLGMTCLVEVHTPEEVTRALDAGAVLLGVNNRDLKTLSVDQGMFAKLVELVPPGVVKVAESGLTSPADAAEAARAGADVVLVGEALVRDHQPRRAVADMVEAGTLARRAR
ncbi:MAG TPA: indole-3-glycerol phosphate synthase TrpC [Propionibacteriaceae bacterium]|nr:indole-3-glycerol phosphate synthase TrpC [Propionibacteriaceae bacterium]